MKAMIYQGEGNNVLIEKDVPQVQEATDAVVKILQTTICGTDLHIIGGDVPEVPLGTTLGHEGIGIVEEIGSAVSHFKVGDKVLISCITSCGKCYYCKQNIQAHCEDGGWILGHLIDGTQAEYVRIPHADNSLYHAPEAVSDDALVMLSDILPTGFEIGVLDGHIKPGQSVAIVGAGPVGLAALITAQFYSPAQLIMIDLDANRLEQAQKMGATTTIQSSNITEIQEQILEITDGRGVDVAIECVGYPQTFDICQKIIAVGGHIANAGVHGKPVNFELEKLWIKNITLSTGLVSANTTDMLLKVIQSGKMDPQLLVTHHYNLSDFDQAYDTFKNASRENALKVIVKNNLS